MEETKVIAKPKIPKLEPRISNIETLQNSADDLKKSSAKLKRLFEKNTYQKKTQLTVLRRYKRRLDAIEREEEERRRKASKRKVKLPDIKKFAGSFFAPGASKDPLKAIGALSAFSSLEKLASGDLLGAIAPGLVAAGMVAGPGLIGSGINKFIEGKKVSRGFDITGRKVSRSAQERYLSRYGESAFNKRFGKQGTNFSQVQSSGSGRAAKAFGRLGKSIIPGVGAVLGAVDAKMRAEEGDITGSRIAGMSATLDAATAASAATGIGVVAAPFLGLASITLDLINFARDITGLSEAESKKKSDIQTRLESQTKKQKDETQKGSGSKTGLSFTKTLIGYERVVNKFQQFSINFKASGGISDEVSPTDYVETNDDTIPDNTTPGTIGGTFESHIMEFRRFRKEKFGASEERFATGSPRLYQIRELGIWEGGKEDNWRINPLADDTAYEKDAHRGSGHWQNRAFDIPVPYNSREGDMVEQFWRSKGYNTIWKRDNHFDHVHVEVPADKANDFFSNKLNQKPKPKPSPTTKPQQPQAKGKVLKSSDVGGNIVTIREGANNTRQYYMNGELLTPEKVDTYRRNHPDAFNVSVMQSTKNYDIAHNMEYNNPLTVVLNMPQTKQQQMYLQQPNTQRIILQTASDNTLNNLYKLSLA